MSTRTQTDVWISRIAIVLGVIAVISIASFIVFLMVGWPLLKILVALGAVSVAGLVRIWTSSLNWGLCD